MTPLTSQFGFYPHPLDFVSGGISVSTLPDLQETTERVAQSETVDGDWTYPGPQLVSNWGEVHERPYSRRVFDLPKTHVIEHRQPDGAEHLNFHVWALSFFLGMRLTTTEAGFLDATPIKAGKLVDFVTVGTIDRSVPIAEDFWAAHRLDPTRASRWVAALHALFVAQYPQALQYERFIYLYTALDACFALAKSVHIAPKNLRHPERIPWMCNLFGMPIPVWANVVGKSAELTDIRNPTLHEALFMGEPLGFALHGIGTNQNLTLEMKALVCRFLAALIGVADTSYIQSETNTRQRQGLRL